MNIGFFVKMTGPLVEKGLWALPEGASRIWVVLVDESEMEVWGRGADGYEIMAKAYATDEIGRFIEDIVEWLSGACDQEVLDRIILVAPSEILRAFHHVMTTDILVYISAEIPLSLSRLSQAERKLALEKMIYI